jgi:hypothetical protein
MNCLTYALGCWRLDWRHGGYIRIRQSQLVKMFPRPWWHPIHLLLHFQHVDARRRVTQYVPTVAQKRRHLEIGLWRAWLDLWNFDGEVVGDDPLPEGGIDPVAASHHFDQR